MHPRMLANVGNMFPTTLHIQQPTDGINQYTQEPTQLWSDVPGLESVKAHVNTMNDRTQIRVPQNYREFVTHEISLQLYSDDIEDGWRAVDDLGYVYHIRGTDTNSQRLYTTLWCQEVSL